MRLNYTNARIVILLYRHVKVVKEFVLLKHVQMYNWIQLILKLYELLILVNKKY
jgi:hypothetical protein